MCEFNRNSVVNKLKIKTEFTAIKTELFLKMLKSITQSAYAKSTLNKYKE